MKNNLIKTSLAFSLFVSISALTYGLGTWNTGYRAVDGADTQTTTNFTNPMDEFVVDNDHGHDLFIPTKTFDELLSVWDNTPVNVELITKKEDFNSLTVDTVVTYYSANWSGDCDDNTGSNAVMATYGSPPQPQSNYISNSRYNILKIDVPADIEGYLNIRGSYDGDQAEENLHIYKQKEGGSSVGISELHGLYKTTATTSNPPIFDYDNDGTDDIEEFFILDPFNNGLAEEENWTAKTSSKVKLFAGSNYFRVQVELSSGFACESGSYANTTSIQYQHTGSFEGFVWLSNQ